MKLLLNDKEIANYLSSVLNLKDLIKDIEIKDEHLESVISWFLLKKEKKIGKGDDILVLSDKLQDKIHHAVSKDLRTYTNKVKETVDIYRKKYYLNIHKHTDFILEKIGEDKVLEYYKNSDLEGFIKSTGLHIDPTSVLVRRKNFNDIKTNCLLRNTVGNESFLVDKLEGNFPFWFIDSGYTNFIEPNKKWHRLVRNHLHTGNLFEAPVDRLGIFNTYPNKWRTSGDKILIIEPGEFAAKIFKINIQEWKYNLEKELEQYTNKKIIFREKTPKKQRSPLYKHLLDEDYYCVVSINSNAATESIWAGIPTITLDRHISNPVSKNKISEINNLYTGSLASWLAMLSYSQFTYDELLSGKAARIVKEYHV